MKIKLTIGMDKGDDQEESFDVIADGRDVRKYEETFAISWLATDMSYIQMTQLAWIAARRHDRFEGDYASFAAVNTGVRSENLEAGEVVAGNPTQEEASVSP
jgi:hypothetical protein